MNSLRRLTLTALKPSSKYFYARHLSSDPIQQSFVKYIREYADRAKSAPMGMVDASDDELKSLQDMLSKLDNAYSAKGQDMTKFPSFSFEEVPLSNPGSTIVADLPKEDIAAGEQTEGEAEYEPGTIVI